MFFVIKIYLALTSTCSGSKPFSVESAKNENQERAIKEQRELEAGIPWNNTGAERTGEFGHQRVPVQHDERQCLGVSTRFIVKVFMNDQFDKEPLIFPASIACSRLSDSRDDEWVKGTQKYEAVNWEKGAVAGKRKAPPFLSPVSSRLFSCWRFLNFAHPTISEPGTGYISANWHLRLFLHQTV